MNGRTTVVILFFWAVLTIVTPMLVRMSASAKPALHFNGEKTEVVLTKVGLQRLLTRRALVDAAPPPAPPLPLATAPEPSLAIIKPRFGIKELVQR